MSGRVFSPKYEVESIHRGIDRDLQRFSGTFVPWYRLDEEATSGDDIYDYGEGRIWKRPVRIQVVDAIQMEGPEQSYEQGFFTRDRLKVIVSSREIERVGFEEMISDHRPFLKDRIVYDGLVYSPSTIKVTGEVREMNTIISVSAEQVRSDELINDPTFFQYVTPA